MLSTCINNYTIDYPCQGYLPNFSGTALHIYPPLLELVYIKCFDLPETWLPMYSFTYFMLVGLCIYHCVVYLWALVSNNLYVKMAKQYKAKTCKCNVWTFLNTAFQNTNHINEICVRVCIVRCFLRTWAAESFSWCVNVSDVLCNSHNPSSLLYWIEPDPALTLI